MNDHYYVVYNPEINRVTLVFVIDGTEHIYYMLPEESAELGLTLIDEAKRCISTTNTAPNGLLNPGTPLIP